MRQNSKMQNQTSVNLQWRQTIGDLDQFLQDHQTGDQVTPYLGITRAHWQANSERSLCANTKCKKNFSLTERPHHCRRCGDIFCAKCVQYNRKLNNLAHPDPNGKSYKVCQACFDQGPQTLGQTRCCTQYFRQCQAYNREQQAKSDNHILRGDRKKRLNVKLECQRLTQGFRQAIGTSGLKKTVHELRCVVSTPPWQRAPNWVFEKLCTSCASCQKGFSTTTRRQHCVVCGMAVCGPCSSKDLIVFVPDDLPKDRQEFEVSWSIIKIVGCPEKEPDICIYLRVCQDCHQKLEDIQVEEFKRSMSDDLNVTSNFWDDSIRVQNKLVNLQDKIEAQLPKYQELIEALEINPGAARSLQPSRRSNTQVLAKAQEDLAEHFSVFVMTIHSLKKNKPTTKSQAVIVKNIVKSYCDYYHENMYLFRECKKKLEACTPLEVLQCIQQIVNRNAINSCYLSVKQLALEALHLTSKYKLTTTLPQALADLEGVVLKDLQESIKQSGEDWTEHDLCINQLLQMQLKDHRLVRPSRRLTQYYGARHVDSFLRERSENVLQQVSIQLATKSAERSFTASKAALKQACHLIASGSHQHAEWELL